MTNTMKIAAFALSATMLGMTAASATIFAKDYHDAGVWNAYDDQTQTYSMKFTDDGSKDGFWLVVSPGDNPKGGVNEYAILYGDRAANRITAYSYDGNNNANSYANGGTFLGTFDQAFTDGGTHATYGDMTMFSLDVSAINSAFGTQEWSGTSFGDEQGIWFHQSTGSSFAYDGNGGITNYSFGGQMWLDTKNQTTWQTECSGNRVNRYYCKDGTTLTNTGSSSGGSVPAPGGLALILMGLAGFGLRRKK